MIIKNGFELLNMIGNDEVLKRISVIVRLSEDTILIKSTEKDVITGFPGAWEMNRCIFDLCHQLSVRRSLKISKDIFPRST